jgi:hypothetical protein
VPAAWPAIGFTEARGKWRERVGSDRFGPGRRISTRRLRRQPIPVQVNAVKNVIRILTSGTEIGLISVTCWWGKDFARVHVCDITSDCLEFAVFVLQCSVQHP